MKKVAVVAANGLGDALIFMVISHNLFLSGIETTTFSSPLCHLKEWFPNHTIRPFPQPNTVEPLLEFDQIIAADHACVHENHPISQLRPLTVLKEKAFDRSQTLVANLQLFCKEGLSLPHFDKKNGITPPTTLQHRKHSKRVALHPTSLDIKRCWPQNKFIQVATLLEKQGLEPVFCMHLKERLEWEGKVPPSQLPSFDTLSTLAAFLYESAYFIGNNSGLGHLASTLEIPTLSLFARESYARLWRPGWSPGSVVAPLPLLPGGRLKQKYWKHLLSPKRVINSFKSLIKNI